MQRTISTILVLLLLVSQSLLSVPHTHTGTSIDEPDGHTSRPHVHLHGVDHHHHPVNDEDSPSKPIHDDSDHDSDAVYVTDASLLNNGRGTEVVKSELLGHALGCDVGLTIESSSLGIRPASLPLRQECARYLRLRSIRC